MKKVIRIYFNVWGWYKNKAMAQKLIQIIPPIHLRVGRKNIHSARCFRMSLIDYWSHSISKWWWKTNWSKFLKLMTELLHPSFFFSKSRLLTNWVPGAALSNIFQKSFLPLLISYFDWQISRDNLFRWDWQWKEIWYPFTQFLLCFDPLSELWKTLKLHFRLHDKCPNPEFFWSLFSHTRTKYGDFPCKPPYSVQVWENADQKSSEYGHFL